MSKEDNLELSYFEIKKQKLLDFMAEANLAEIAELEQFDFEIAARKYGDFKKGKIKNLERNRFRWMAPGPAWTEADMFEFIPRKTDPMSFVRHTGEEITPRNMYTDVGSIPRIAGLFRRGLTPWGYAPAYIIHDWEFELHHCQANNKSFKEVRDTMMECVKTLMEEKLAPKNLVDFWLLHQAISSSFARKIWDRPPVCSLPPDKPEFKDAGMGSAETDAMLDEDAEADSADPTCSGMSDDEIAELVTAKPPVKRIESPYQFSREGARISYIVLHYTTTRDLESTIEHFLDNPRRVACHYIVARDGSIVQMVRDHKLCYHGNTKNRVSIGIEHCAEEGDAITPRQEAASLALIRWLKSEYDIENRHIIPHKCTPSNTACPGEIFERYGATGASSCQEHFQAVQAWLRAKL